MVRNIAWAHAGANRELCGSGRELGYAGVLLQHAVLDRALHSAVSRMTEQALILVKQQLTAKPSTGQARLVGT